MGFPGAAAPVQDRLGSDVGGLDCLGPPAGSVLPRDAQLARRAAGVGEVQLVAGPSAMASGVGAAAAPRLPAAGTAGDPSGVIAFPPRNEPFAFREELERKYRDGLRRSPSSTYVDLEGDIVWTQEYLRYRVNQCDHATAVQKVLDQIDGRGISPVCGNPPPGGAVPFPPRNEPYAFRQELEGKYRDGLRRSPTSSYVDIEGAIVAAACMGATLTCVFILTFWYLSL